MATSQRLLPFVLAMLLSFTGACTDEDEPEGGDSSASPESSDTSSTSPTTEASPTSTVEPASGVRLALGAIEANAPEGWKQEDLETDYQVSARDPELVTSLTLLQVPDPSDGAGGVELAAKQSLQAASWLQKPTILEPTEIDGVEVYHIGGRVDSSSFVDEYGTTVDGQAVRLRFQMTEIMSLKERQELVESVLPTVQLG